MILRKHKKFIKSYNKLSPKLQSKVDAAVILFTKEPLHKELRNHSLNRKYKDFRSIDVDDDYRIIFKELEEKYEIVLLSKVGTHNQLYGG